MDQNNQGTAWCPEGDENEEASGTQWGHIAGQEDVAPWPYHSHAASGSGVSSSNDYAYYPGPGTPSPYLMPTEQNGISSGYTQTSQGSRSNAGEVNLFRDRGEVFGTQQLESDSTGFYPPQPHDVVQSTESYAHPSHSLDEHREVASEGYCRTGTNVNVSYPAQYSNHIAGASSMSYSPSASQLNTYSPAPNTAQSAANYTVACPYRCGVVLTGVHAVGNLTRHLKTKACAASGKAKVRYPCPIDGCTKEYSRSDGLRVHMRKQHGAPAANPRNGSPVDDLNENDDDEQRRLE
ncbi:hypothetical protein FB567DRAFT_634447 [Paraphoma chrysanthemicola]|uniref:C2H2-type domain-containing protein n=1 Tax=Paraphoma chrysanthemicola TaxID=798071 RepID=A0A8K0QTX5_9PLEO|nr:hypothetical protein FB567DRAFT_634447 [Paraphoma chrysanthemicola]